MNEASLSPKNAYFMDNKDRNWYWVLMTFLIVNVVLQVLIKVLITICYESAGLGISTMLLVGFQIFALLGLTSLLVVYGLKNTEKVFRTLFLILACSELLSAVSVLLSDINYINALAGRLADIGNGLNRITAISTYLFRAAWIVCLLVIVFNPKAGGLLRISALLLALDYIYKVLSIWLPLLSMKFIYEKFGIAVYSAMNTLQEILSSLIYIALMAFFFGAMTFTRRKGTKVC